MHNSKKIKFVPWFFSKSSAAFEITRIIEPAKPIDTPSIFLRVISSSLKKKKENIVIIKGMIALHNPTNTVDRCSCAIAKIVNGRKFEKIATPKQKNQYFADLLKLNNSTLKKTENKKTTRKPIIILKDAIWTGLKALIANLMDKKELPHKMPKIESKIQGYTSRNFEFDKILIYWFNNFNKILK